MTHESVCLEQLGSLFLMLSLSQVWPVGTLQGALLPFGIPSNLGHLTAF